MSKRFPRVYILHLSDSLFECFLCKLYSCDKIFPSLFTCNCINVYTQECSFKFENCEEMDPTGCRNLLSGPPKFLHLIPAVGTKITYIYILFGPMFYIFIYFKSSVCCQSFFFFILYTGTIHPTCCLIFFSVHVLKMVLMFWSCYAGTVEP